MRSLRVFSFANYYISLLDNSTVSLKDKIIFNDLSSTCLYFYELYTFTPPRNSLITLHIHPPRNSLISLCSVLFSRSISDMALSIAFRIPFSPTICTICSPIAVFLGPLIVLINLPLRSLFTMSQKVVIILRFVSLFLYFLQFYYFS